MILKSFGIDFPYHWFRWYEEIKTIPQLDSYLEEVVSCGQEWHSVFSSLGYVGASSCKQFENNCGLIEYNSNLPLLARESMESDLTNATEHTKVQRHIMNKDVYAVACEVPVFLNDWNMFGHIDLIRFVDGCIEIWDYKNHLNNNVKSQLYCYGLMLSIRLMVPLNTLRVGYFTKSNAYILILG